MPKMIYILLFTRKIVEPDFAFKMSNKRINGFESRAGKFPIHQFSRINRSAYPANELFMHNTDTVFGSIYFECLCSQDVSK